MDSPERDFPDVNALSLVPDEPLTPSSAFEFTLSRTDSPQNTLSPDLSPSERTRRRSVDSASLKLSAAKKNELRHLLVWREPNAKSEAPNHDFEDGLEVIQNAELSRNSLILEHLWFMLDYVAGPELTEANFSPGWCESITDVVNDEHLLRLSEQCPNLELLGVDGCQLVTDAGVRAVAQGCAELVTVHLSSCPLLTDASVLALAQNCSKLRWLRLDGVSALTEGCLSALATFSMALKWLYLPQKLKDVRSSALDALKERQVEIRFY